MLRTLVTGAALVLMLATLGPVGIVAAWVTGSARPLYGLTFPAVRLLQWSAGIRTRVVGRERVHPGQNYLFIANHQSNLDPPLLLLAIDRNILAVAKASLFRLPILGSVLRSARFIPVQRDNRERAVRAVDAAAEALADGRDFLVFAEGTRSRDGNLLPFKKGPFVMAIKSQVPLVPTVVSGTAALLAKGDWRIRPGEVRVEFLDPVSPAGMEFADRDRLREQVRASMVTALGADAAAAAPDCIGPGAPVT